MDLAVFYTVGTALIVAGIVVIVLAVILASLRRGGSKGEGEAEGKNETHAAGIIMIGPIPIIFGTDKKSVKTVLLLALALTIMALIAYLVYYWLVR
ncbi:MAG: DUF131 domain-containing protein [Candidatus Bathyarchaeota archaeon]|nr:DUF131 domain-containing protein [Candidatus Bathyarchaeota archaeon]